MAFRVTRASPFCRPRVNIEDMSVEELTAAHYLAFKASADLSREPPGPGLPPMLRGLPGLLPAPLLAAQLRPLLPVAPAGCSFDCSTPLLGNRQTRGLA